MKKILSNIFLPVAAIVAVAVACTPESADLHPNHREVAEEPEEDPEIVTDELGTIVIRLADYQKLGLKIKSVDISGNNGEEITGAAAEGTSGVAVSNGAAGNVVATWSTPVDITWTTTTTPWTGTLVGAPEFAVQIKEGSYDKGLTFKIKDDKDRVYELVYDSLVLVEAEESDTLGTFPITPYFGTANCILTDAAAGTLEVDVTPHVSFSTMFTPDGGNVYDADGKTLVAAKGASIVWQQGETGVDGDVVSNPTLTGNTLKLTKTGKKGNAVVAISDDSDIIWSFHIWVGEAKDVECSFPEKYGNFTMLDRNLGATCTTPKNQDSYGLFYQWGRKDALRRQQNIARGERATEPEYTACNHEMTSETVGTISYSIKHPDVRIISTIKDWHYAYRCQPLWGNVNASSSPQRSSVKTVYDPCPEGYQIPEKEAFSGFTLGDQTVFDNNYGFPYPTGVGENTIFFPANGVLKVGANTIQYHEYEGFCWSNNPGGNGVYILRLGINTSATKSAVGAMDRAYGCAVRCIKTSSL